MARLTGGIRPTRAMVKRVLNAHQMSERGALDMLSSRTIREMVSCEAGAVDSWAYAAERTLTLPEGQTWSDSPGLVSRRHAFVSSLLNPSCPLAVSARSRAICRPRRPRLLGWVVVQTWALVDTQRWGLAGMHPRVVYLAG